MNRMKKFAALLLALAMLFSLAACKDANVENETLNNTSKDPVSTEPAATEPTGDTAAPTGEYPDSLDDIELVPGTVTEKLIYIDEEITADDARLNNVIATCGDLSLTNREFQIYYWMEYINLIQTYGEYLTALGLDQTISPAEQLCTLQEKPMTWEHFFINAGFDQFNKQAAVVTKALSEGFDMSSLDTQLRDAMTSLQSQAESYGFSSVNAMLQASFGPGVTKADYETYLRNYFAMTAYKQQLADEMDFTDEELEEYYVDNVDSMGGVGQDHPDVNVRHILIKPEDSVGNGTPSEEEWAAAEQKAQDILSEYEQDPTEDHFAELANTYSDDGGSNTKGGLYESVYPGQMVQPFNDWCFDEARKPGDVGIVKYENADHYNGIHIIYYVEQLDSYTWKAAAKQGLAENDLYNIVEEIRQQYPVEVNYTDLVFGMPNDTEAAG